MLLPTMNCAAIIVRTIKVLWSGASVTIAWEPTSVSKAAIIVRTIKDRRHVLRQTMSMTRALEAAMFSDAATFLQFLWTIKRTQYAAAARELRRHRSLRAFISEKKRLLQLDVYSESVGTDVLLRKYDILGREAVVNAVHEHAIKMREVALRAGHTIVRRFRLRKVREAARCVQAAVTERLRVVLVSSSCELMSSSCELVSSSEF